MLFRSICKSVRCCSAYRTAVSTSIDADSKSGRSTGSICCVHSGSLVPLTINRASSQHVHRSALTLGAANLTVTQSGTTPSFTNLGSIQLGASRSFAVTGGSLDLSGGTFTVRRGLSIEQGDPILEVGALLVELLDLRLTLVEQRKVLTPGDEAIGSGERQAAQGQQIAERQELPDLFPVERSAAHLAKESQLTPRFKRFRGGFTVFSNRRKARLLARDCKCSYI